MMLAMERESVTYRIPALTTYVDVDELRENFERAQAGDRVTYAIGPYLKPGALVPAVARKLAEGGRGHLLQEREGRGYRYFIVKSTAPRLRVVEALNPASAEARVLALLIEAAQAGRRCPGNTEIADRLDLDSRYQARDRVQALVRLGHIRVVEQLRFGGRVIEIVASGLRTAGC
jgi:hypothetical protein